VDAHANGSEGIHYRMGDCNGGRRRNTGLKEMVVERSRPRQQRWTRTPRSRRERLVRERGAEVSVGHVITRTADDHAKPLKLWCAMRRHT